MSDLKGEIRTKEAALLLGLQHRQPQHVLWHHCFVPEPSESLIMATAEETLRWLEKVSSWGGEVERWLSG